MEQAIKLDKHDMANVRAIAERIRTYTKRLEQLRLRLDKVDADYAALAERAKAKVRREMEGVKADIDFWEAPVKARYGAGVDELLEGAAAKAAPDPQPAADAAPAPDPEPGVYPPLPEAWR